MSLKLRFLCFLDIFLRVPSLIFIDEILKTDFFYEFSFSFVKNYPKYKVLEVIFLETIPIGLFKLIVCLLGSIFAFLLFILWTSHLLQTYLVFLTVALTFLSYWKNVSFLENLNFYFINYQEFLQIICNIIIQTILASLYCYIKQQHSISWIEQKIIYVAFIGPPILPVLSFSQNNCKHFTSVSILMVIVIIVYNMWCNGLQLIIVLTLGFKRAKDFAQNFGLSALIENEWQRLNVPAVLRLFWILSIISLMCHFIGKMYQKLLMTEKNTEDKSLGTVSAILFYILALQTGLTSLEPEKRFVRLCRNFCLLITAMFHFLHNLVAPTLMSLSAARNPSRERHFRALLASIFLLITPTMLLFILWNRYESSTWLFAVTAFSVEVIIKVLVSLATYILFIMDARKDHFWEKLDDYIYYVKAFGNSVEFSFGIFLFFNGAWILMFESGGAIRALMMCIHAYFNIWCEAKAGWKVFIKRQDAVHKISSLPEASSEDVTKYNDVCSICYQEMVKAKVTACKHYFHGVCLRKWLYVQDRCPLCHEIIILIDNLKSN
uniref:CSON008907 protein n=1 Tax=Culicoides sonorensis TaxID=179676 RepID=A0A336M4R1_CULSO